MAVARLRRGLGALLALALAGCGGGLVIGFGGDAYPDVSLVAASDSALPGQAVRLAAAAEDDDAVLEVQFFRVGPDGGDLYLGRDTAAPYQWSAVVPAGTPRGSTLVFFARAIDTAGQASDSAGVAVRVD